MWTTGANDAQLHDVILAGVAARLREIADCLDAARSGPEPGFSRGAADEITREVEAIFAASGLGG